MATLHGRARVVQEFNISRTRRALSVTRGYEKIDVEWAPDAANEIPQENEGSLQQPQQKYRGARLVRGGDFPAHRFDALSDLSGGIHDAAKLASPAILGKRARGSLVIHVRP